MEQPVGDLQLKTGYFGDPKAFAALVDLLRDIFDIDIGLLDRFGGPDPGAMPFGYFDAGGRCVANFSAFPMPLLIGGKRLRAVGYQSGAVRPEFRGQGLYRDLMARAFAWAEGQDFDLGLLLTDKPALYLPYGFRSVSQHMFCGTAPPVRRGQAARALSIDKPDDVSLIRRLLAIRQPVSERFAAVGPNVEFLLNACFDPEIHLSHLEKLDAVVAWKVIEGRLSLLDVVAAEIPPLAALIAALHFEGAEIAVCFPPDRLDWPQARPEPHAGDCELMMAGDPAIDLPRDAFMLSPMAEF